MIFFGSFIPALLWGVALANLIRGVPIDENMTYVGGFFNLLNPYALIGGLASLAIFTLHGATFLTLKLGGGIEDRARAFASKLWYPAVLFLLLFVAGTYWMTDVHERLGLNPGVVPAVAVHGPHCQSLVHHQPQRRLELHSHRGVHRLRYGDGLHRAVPAGHGLEPESGLEPDHLQRGVEPLHPQGHEHRSRPPGAGSAHLPVLDLLDLPQEDHSGLASALLRDQQ